MPPLPEGFDPDDPARFVAGIALAEWLDLQTDKETERLRTLARSDQYEAEKRERLEKRIKRAEKRAEKGIERVPPHITARAQTRLDGLVPDALRAYIGILADMAARPDAFSAGELAMAFRIGERFGFQPDATLADALELRARREQAGSVI